MNSAPVTLPLMSSTTATGEAAAAGEASASRPRQRAIVRFIFRTPLKSAGSLVAPAPKWFHGWIKNTRKILERYLAGTPAEPTDSTYRSAGTTIGRADRFLT